MKLTVEQALQQGVAAQKEGNLREAERWYRAILHSLPAHPDANHNLGVLAISVNKADLALPFLKTALEAQFPTFFSKFSFLLFSFRVVVLSSLPDFS